MPKNKSRQVQKRQQVRADRKNAKRKERRRVMAREKHRIMSRQKDIDNLTADIEAKQKELQGLQTKVQTYSQEVTETITAMLKKAGIFEKVNKLEEERRVFQQEAQQKANVLQAEIQDAVKMRNWLVGQDKADDPDDDEDGDEKKDEKPDLKAVVKPSDEDADEGDAKDTPKKPSL